MKNNKRMIDPSSQDFGTICVCAVRYSLGRQTYMPKLVIDFIQPLLPFLDKTALDCLMGEVGDVVIFDKFGEQDLNKTDWTSFCNNIASEVTRRQNEKHHSEG